MTDKKKDLSLVANDFVYKTCGSLQWRQKMRERRENAKQHFSLGKKWFLSVGLN